MVPKSIICLKICVDTIAPATPYWLIVFIVEGYQKYELAVAANPTVIQAAFLVVTFVLAAEVALKTELPAINKSAKISCFMIITPLKN